MTNSPIDKCPRCGDPLEQGFAARAVGLSFVKSDKLEHIVFLDEDVSRSGLRKLFPWKAEFFRSAICRSCKLYLIDYGQVYSRKRTEEIAGSLQEL